MSVWTLGCVSFKALLLHVMLMKLRIKIFMCKMKIKKKN